MLTDIKTGLKSILILCSVFLAACDSKPGTQFMADLFTESGDMEQDSRIYYKDGRYRVEIGVDSVLLIYIIDPEKNIGRIMYPDRKSYLEMPADSQRILDIDPLQGIKQAAAEADIRILGADSISGFVCEKQRLSKDGSDIYTRWVSPKYPLPLKLIKHVRPDIVMELQNIVDTTIDESLFEIPVDYTPDGLSRKVGPAGDEEGDSVRVITKSPPVKQPITRLIRLEVNLDPEKPVTFRLNNIVQESSRVAFSFFREGRFLNEDEMGPHSNGHVTLEKLGLSTSNTWPPLADKLVVEGESGRMLVEVTQP